MNYRIRSQRTGGIVHPNDPLPTEDLGAPEWVLETEIIEGEWVPSAFHKCGIPRDLLSVRDARTLSDAIEVLRKAAK